MGMLHKILRDLGLRRAARVSATRAGRPPGRELPEFGARVAQGDDRIFAPGVSAACGQGYTARTDDDAITLLSHATG